MTALGTSRRSFDTSLRSPCMNSVSARCDCLGTPFQFQYLVIWFLYHHSIRPSDVVEKPTNRNRNNGSVLEFFGPF